MKRSLRRYTVSLVLLVSLVPLMSAAEESMPTAAAADSMPLWQARRTLTTYFGGKYSGLFDLGLRCYSVNRASISFAPDRFEFDVTGHSGASCNNKPTTKHARVELKALPSLVIHCSHYICDLREQGEKELKAVMLGDRQAGFSFYVPYEEGVNQRCSHNPGCIGAAEKLTAALNCLHIIAVNSDTARSEFRQKAAAWRALANKPAIPDEVRRQRLLAENAVKEKNLEKALTHYETGLQSYPTWPQGYFNGALIAAKLSLYDQAIEFMQAYLELVPDASDAQAARDQIVIWQDKAKDHSKAENSERTATE